MRAWLDTLAPVLDRLAAGDATPVQTDSPELERLVQDLALDVPRSRSEALGLCARLLEGGLRTSHPRCLGWFTPAPLEASAVADLLVSWVNPQLAVRASSPAPIAAEERLARELAAFFGLGPDAGGTFTSGGSEATLTATLLALAEHVPDFVERGLCGAGAPPTLYASVESHKSLEKIAVATGLGREAVRLIACDASLRMQPEALQREIDGDRRAGRAPLMAVGTAGTTNAGAIDPLPELAAVCERNGLWFHVDAAWGGAAALCPTLRPLLAGVERADSVTFDPHKGLAMPLGTGLLLVREARRLRAVFAPNAAYVLPPDAPPDPYCASLGWSRRFTGMRLLLPLLEVGWSGLARRFERQVELGRRLAAGLRDRRWELVTQSPLAIVCFADAARPSAAHHAALARAVAGSGRAWVASTSVKGRPALRACIANADTTEADLEAVLDVLDRARAEVGHG